MPKPKHIKNKKVGLIAPAGQVTIEKIKKSMKNIELLGLSPIKCNISEKTTGYLAGIDTKRLNELEKYWTDTNVDTIFCIRGGYGTTRLLQQINYEKIKNNPKIFIGFSDITALQSAFWEKSRLVTFHGIVAISDFTEYIVKQLKDLIFHPIKNYTLPIKTMQILNPGTTTGRIVGGNLSLLTALIGTEYLYKFENKIVFIEEIAEPPYKIDRMITHLLMATDLSKAAAIVLGKFNKCNPEDFNIPQTQSYTINEIIEQKFSHLKIPITFDLNFGHIKNGLIFPIGIKAELNTKLLTIKLLENPIE